MRSTPNMISVRSNDVTVYICTFLISSTSVFICLDSNRDFSLCLEPLESQVQRVVRTTEADRRRAQRGERGGRRRSVLERAGESRSHSERRNAAEHKLDRGRRAGCSGREEEENSRGKVGGGQRTEREIGRFERRGAGAQAKCFAAAAAR